MKKPNIKIYVRNRIYQDKFLEPRNKYLKYVEAFILTLVCVGINVEAEVYSIGIFLWLMYFYFSKLYLEFR